MNISIKDLKERIYFGNLDFIPIFAHQKRKIKKKYEYQGELSTICKPIRF